MSSLANVCAADHSLETATTFTTEQARARFEERFREFENKARHLFGRWRYRPQARDEAVADSLALTWHRIVAMVKAGKANDHLMTSAFYFSCRQTHCGRKIRGSHSRDLFERINKRDQPEIESIGIPFGAIAENFVSRCASVPDIVQFRIDVPDWLDTLKPIERDRALDLATGATTKELAKEWRVSPAAVSQLRRRLMESYERFTSR
jgi:hypothetical protein